MGLMNIYWPCDPLSSHSSNGYPYTANAAAQKDLLNRDLLNRSAGFFKSIALVGLMR